MPPCSSYTVSLGACYMFRVCICTPGFIRKYRKWCDFIYCIISSIWAGMSVSWTCRAARIDGWRFQNAAVVYKEQFRKQLAATSGLVSKVTENEKTAVISILSSLNQNKESVMQHSEDVFLFLNDSFSTSSLSWSLCEVTPAYHFPLFYILCPMQPSSFIQAWHWLKEYQGLWLHCDCVISCNTLSSFILML